MKVDDEDVVYPRSHKANPNWLVWVIVISLGVLIGGLLHDGARLLTAKVVVEYELQKMQRGLDEAQKQREQQAQARAQQLADRHIREEKIRRQNSDLCRFWTEQNNSNPSERSANEMKKNC